MKMIVMLIMMVMVVITMLIMMYRVTHGGLDFVFVVVRCNVMLCIRSDATSSLTPGMVVDVDDTDDDCVDDGDDDAGRDITV